MNKLKSTCTLFLLLLTTWVGAQEANLFYFSSGIPQAVYLNPAMHNAESKIVLGVAALNGFYGNLNSDVTFSDMFTNDPITGKTSLDLNSMFSQINGDGGIDESFSLPLLFLGYNNGRNHYYFSASEKQPLSLYFNDDLITLLQNGNAQYAGKTLKAQLDLSIYHYGEYAFGYSRDFLENKLTVGVTAKLLFGKGALKSDNVNMAFYTSPNFEGITITGQGGVYVSGPYQVENGGNTLSDLRFSSDFSAGSYFTNHSNPGFGFDIGVRYQVNPRIGIAASVTDLGGINWKNQTTGFSFSGEFDWIGTDISDVIISSNSTDDFSNLTDSVGGAFTLNTSNSEFRTKLPTKLYVGGTFKVNDKLNVGVINKVRFNETGTTTNMFMVTANSRLTEKFGLTGSYAITRGSYDNLGLGLMVRTGFVQVILGTGNIIRLISIDKAKYTSVRFGVNFLFGKIPDRDAVIGNKINESL